MSFKAVVVISVLISLSLHKTSESDSVLIIGEVIFPVLNSKTESPPKLIGPVKSVDAATSAKVYSEIPWINFWPSAFAYNCIRKQASHLH